MMTFSGIDYIKIDVCNNFGLDKLSWTDRIDWFDKHHVDWQDLIQEADNKFLFIKGMRAYKDALKGKPTGFIMALDATASGLQIMSCLSGCKKTARHVNLINTGSRQDVYTTVANGMNGHLVPEYHVNRPMIKKPVMTHYYNKSRPDGLNDIQTVAFFRTLNNEFTGAEDVMEIINECWDSNALEHSWTTPDKHRVRVKVEEKEDKRIPIDELKVTFTYRYNSNKPSKRKTSLCPNYIHSIDGWVAREMVRRANKLGFRLVHIHDSFWASPNHMNKVRQLYVEILAELAASTALQDFVQEQGKDVFLIKDSEDLAQEILQSEYALS